MMLHTPLDSLYGKLDVFDRSTCRFLKVQAKSKDKVAGITVHFSAVLMMLPDLPDIEIREKRLTLNGLGKYVLLEMPLMKTPIYSFDIWFKIVSKGIRRIETHPA